MIESILTGLRLGAIILWGWIGLRVLLDSYTITAEAESIRIKGWKYFRASLLVMSFVVVFLFSPADILIANKVIIQEQRQILSAAGVFGLHISAVLLHMGLDYVNNHIRRSWPMYVAISLLSILYGLEQFA